ncbi:hypothetical protein V496_00470 [Pseudogymnoascus sp. VKM F-4515 (FW-2607)]|nr:hypothetical protein V496_00470 [Pseudogymnoascus sp. VKM F-4515 (FW-2607)]
MPISGVRCPTCTASGHEIWVIPGKHCGYCGTPCDGDNHGLSGPNLKAQTASSPKYSHFPHLSFLFPITTAELPPNDSEENPLRLKSKLLEIVESRMPGVDRIDRIVNRIPVDSLLSTHIQISGSLQSHVLQLVTCVTPTSQLPFTSDQVQEVLKTWLLPNEWLERSTKNELLQFAWCDIRATDDGSQHLQFLVRDQKDSVLTNLAISANLTSNTVRESLEANASLEAVVARIGVSKDFAGHPLLLPVILLEQRVQAIERLLNNGFSGATYSAYSLIVNTIRSSVSKEKEDKVQSDMRIMTQGMFDAHKRNSILKKDISDMRLLASAIERGFSLLEKMSNLLIGPRFKDWTVVKSRYEFLSARISALEASMTRAVDEVQIVDNMIYNLINQQDSRLNCSIAQDSRRVAIATSADSSAMTTMAFVTTLFLPGTFIASLFSSGLFSFAEPDPGAVISRQFWIFWIIAVPLTVIVVGICIYRSAVNFPKSHKGNFGLDEGVAENKGIVEEGKWITRFLKWVLT